MKNKYYQPSKEEFYIGFEFESTYILFQKHPGDSWTKSILSDEHNWFYDSYDNDAVPSEFRVKYLDRSDIEDLGFKLTGGKLIRDYRDSFEYHPDNHIHYVLDYTYSINKVRILKEDINYFHEDEIVLFEGTIKNKSELKILLKQLNIK